MKDKVSATDTFRAGHDQSTEVTMPCPKCGKGSKEHHDGMRICSSRICRHVFPALDASALN